VSKSKVITDYKRQKSLIWVYSLRSGKMEIKPKQAEDILQKAVEALSADAGCI
jgi:hypothetical protein